MPKLQMEKHTLLLNKAELNNHTCLSLVSSRKLLTRLQNTG